MTAVMDDTAPVEMHTCRMHAIRSQAEEMLRAHGLADWSFTFNHRKTEMGLCRYDVKVIELSLYFVRLNGAEAVLAGGPQPDGKRDEDLDSRQLADGRQLDEQRRRLALRPLVLVEPRGDRDLG